MNITIAAINAELPSHFAEGSSGKATESQICQITYVRLTPVLV